MVAEGVEREEALKHCFLFDSKGLVTCNRGDKLAHNKVPFAHDVENCKTFIEAVRALRPTGIIGVAAQPAPSMPKCSRHGRNQRASDRLRAFQPDVPRRMRRRHGLP